MSFQGGGSTSGSSKPGIGGLRGKLSDLISTDPTRRDKGLGAFTLDPSVFGRIGDTFGETAFGNNLNVENTPAGQRMIGALKDTSQRNLGDSLAQVRSGFAQSGQNLSGPLMASETQAATQNNANLNDTLANQLFGSYSQERGRQLASLGALNQYQLTPESILSNLAPLFSKQTSTTSRSNPLTTYMGK